MAAMQKPILILAALFLGGVARADWQQVQSLRTGEPIMVHSGFVTDAGKFVSATSDAVVLDTRAGAVTVAKGDIDDVLVYRSHGERVHSGLLKGGIAAGLTAALLFPLSAGLAHPTYAAPAAATASNGASVGLVGYLFGRTKRIYRRK